MIAPINEDFIEYFENPDSRSGAEPSPLNLDYLKDSYADSSLASSESLPESYDLRDYGRVTRVRNQGIYGTCWAFAALASATSSILEQFPTATFSPAHLNWFSFVGDADAEMYQYKYDSLPNESIFNFGGNNRISVGTFSAWKGPVSSEALPYNSITENGEDLSAFENMRYDADYHLQDAFFVPVNSDGGMADIEVAKKTLMEYGGLSMAYCSDDKYFNEDTCAQYCPMDLTEVSPNHEVLIVGWDDNYPKENFKEDYRPENDGAWLVQNSWGTLYDKLGGYFWLSYEDKTVYESDCFILEPADNYAENYQLDTGGWTMSVTGERTHGSATSSYAANLFTAKEDEQLEAVSFYTTDADAEYQISVYTNPKDNDPTSGEMVYSGEKGTEPYAGYHTEELDSAVELEKGDTFAVVIKITNPKYDFPIALNTSYTYPSVDKLEYSGARGKSFVSGDGESWTDAVDYSYYLTNSGTYLHVIVSNACIKAFTNPIPSEGEAVSNIRFSLLEGPVALGSRLTLEGADTIMYQIDNGEARTYNGGVTIDKPCTITAWGVKNGKSGNKVSRTYTQAAGQLNYLTLERNGAIENVEIGKDNKAFITINKGDSPLSLLACSADDISIDGEKIGSDEWSQEFSLGDGESRKDIKIEVSGAGKETTEYTVSLVDIDAAYSIIGLDIETEKINYDQNAYEVLDENGKPVESGSVISDYAELAGEDSAHQKFFIYDKASGKLIDSIPVPQRQQPPSLDFDAENELIFQYDDNTVYSSSDDDFALEKPFDELHLEPGKTYRFRCPADLNYGFASDVKEFTIAPRVDTPSVKAESVGVDAIQLTEIDGCEYRIAGEEWQDSPVFIGLEPNTSYTFEIRHKCEINKSGNKTFFDLASDISTVEATTLDGIMAPVQLNYHGMMINDLYYGILEMTMNDLSYGLHEGENVIDVNKFVMDYGFIAASNEDEFVTINVDRIDGELVPEQDIIFNVEMIEFSDDGSVVPVNAEDYSFTVLYWDSEKQGLVDKQSSNFVVPGIIVEKELNIPDGYELQDDFFPEIVDVPYLGYCDGVWRVYYAETFLNVLATEPSTEPTEPSTEPTEPSTDVSLNEDGGNVYTGENRELVSVTICAFAVSAAFIVGLGLRRRKETDD